MRFGVPHFVILSLGLSLLACRKPLVLAPVVSGSIITQGSVGLRILPAAKVKALESWFAENPGGWHQSPASYLPSDRFILTHKGGATTEINVLPKGLVVVNKASGQYVRQFNTTEISQLLSIARF
jgi:hypothetical protein